MTLFEKMKEAYTKAGIAFIVGTAAEVEDAGAAGATPDDAFLLPTIVALPMGGHLDQLISTVFQPGGELIEETMIVEDDVLSEVLYARQQAIDTKSPAPSLKQFVIVAGRSHDGSDTEPEE